MPNRSSAETAQPNTLHPGQIAELKWKAVGRQGSLWVAQRFSAAVRALNLDGFSRCGTSSRRSPHPSQQQLLAPFRMNE